MTKVRNTRDPRKPAYDNPTGDKGGLTDLSHGGAPATGQNEKDAKRVRARRSDRAVGHDSDKKLGEKPPSGKPTIGSG
jgi:hypothetical protein